MRAATQGLRGALGVLSLGSFTDDARYIDPRRGLIQWGGDDPPMLTQPPQNTTAVVNSSDGSVMVVQESAPLSRTLRHFVIGLGAVGLGIMALGAGVAGYHGYKRSGGRVGSTVGWAVLGGILPIITVPVALAQGYGKRR